LGGKPGQREHQNRGARADEKGRFKSFHWNHLQN
jgi:hypothetical protein